MTGIPALLGGLGLVFLGFGLLSALLAALQPATDIGWIWGNLVIGALLLGSAVVMNLDRLRERLRSGEGRRIGKYGTSAVLATVFGLAILFSLAFLSTRYTQRFDWTQEKVHTLSDQTQKVLADLDEDVEVTAFFNPLDAPPYRDLLDRYAYASERFHVTFADPNVRPDLVESLALDDRDLARGLMRIEAGGDHVDLTDFDEESITNAIVKLTRSGTRKVYFVWGHNERAALEEGADEAQGMSRAVEALRNETYQVERLLLAAAGEVPEDADVVVVPGPTRPLADEEHAALQGYVERGGALLVMVDPRANTDIGADLLRWGARLGDDIVLDRSLALFGRAASPFAAEYADHPITRGMRETVLFHLARSVEPTAEATERLTAIVSTGEASWAEKDLRQWVEEGTAGYDPGVDQLGPIPLAVAGVPLRVDLTGAAGDDSAPEARIVVYGDSDFATNELIDGYRNRDLFVNSVNWLMGDEEHIAIRPNRSRASRFQLTSGQFRTIQLLSLFVLPEAIAVLGVIAWWSRLKAPGR